MAASKPNLHLLATTWNAFFMLVAVLEPFKLAMKSLQYEQLTFGDFFGIWLNCKLKIAKLVSTSSRLEQLLLSAMEKRETDLLKNDLFLASLYLDPQCKVFISKIDQIVATQHLQQTWDRLKLLQQEIASDLSGADPDSSETSSADDDFDTLIEAREKAAQQHRQSFTSVISTFHNAIQRNLFMVLLNSFANEPELGKNEHVLRYWEQFKESKRELYELS